MSEKQKLSVIEKAIKLSGLALIVVMLLSHIFYKDIDLYILLIPTAMIGIDTSKLSKK